MLHFWQNYSIMPQERIKAIFNQTYETIETELKAIEAEAKNFGNYHKNPMLIVLYYTGHGVLVTDPALFDNINTKKMSFSQHHIVTLDGRYMNLERWIRSI